MKLPLSQEFAASGFFLLRTPLLPIDEFLNLSCPAVDGLEPTVVAKRSALREQLRNWVERKEVKEALWIASPELLQSLPVWCSDPESAKGRKLEQAMYRYFARMTARATPFGAFAGCSTGFIASSTYLELGPRAGYRRSTRLDMEYLCSLAEYLSASPGVSGHLRFRCNTTLHQAAGNYHHIRTDWQDGARTFQLVGTAPTVPLNATLARAVSGATAGELAATLVAGDDEISLADAQNFIARLADSQILVSDLLPPVTGKEPILYMAGELDQATVSGPAAELRNVHEQLRSLDAGGLGADPSAYDAITGAVQRLGGEFKPGRLVQLDLFKPVAMATLDSAILDAVLDAVDVLHSIRDQSAQTVFDQFKESFRQRYQDQEVPLLLALDDEAGIGFENEDNPTAEPLLAAIDFRPAEEAAPVPEEQTLEVPEADAKPQDDQPVAELTPVMQGEAVDSESPARLETPKPEQKDDNTRGAILARRMEELWAKKEMVLALDEELLEQLKVENPLPMPDAFAVMGAAFCFPDGRPGFYAHTMFGPSGVNLLTRFRHGDQQLSGQVQSHVRAEEALETGGAVFAEIVHLPEGRVGNVICRPALRQYEIPLLGTPGIPADRQIALSDLTVSLREGCIVLRSRRLSAEVLPRLTTAHNFNSPRSLKLYKFLCLLQHQGTCPEVFWEWGTAGKAAFLPRVALGDVVLSLACWRISKETALELSSGRLPIAEWRESIRMPRYASIAEYDNQLLIDFENPLAVETFLELIKKQTETVMVEMFPPPDALPVRGPEGTFVHEMVVPFVRRAPRPKAEEKRGLAAGASTPTGSSQDASDRAQAEVTPAQTAFVPGSEWFFAKLYCSPSHADRILQEMVAPLAKQVMASGWARRWFFIRYSDPEWHVRLRFQGDPAALSQHVWPLFRRMVEEQQEQGTVWRVHYETYQPETDRYGGPLAIGVAEHLFQLDSEFCLNLLPITSADPDLRWRLAAGSVDCLLSGLGLPLNEKEQVTRTLARERERVFVIDQDYKQQMAQTFRSRRETLAKVLAEVQAATGADGAVNSSVAVLAADASPAGALPPAALPADALAALAGYTKSLQPLRLELEELRRSGQLGQTLSDLATSFVHMHLNRTFRYRHHEQEAVVCELLSRMYASRIARATGAASTQP